MAIPWLDACLNTASDETGKPLAIHVQTHGLQRLLVSKRGQLIRHQTQKLVPGYRMKQLPTSGCSMSRTRLLLIPHRHHLRRTCIESNRIVWNCEADLENGLSHFIVKRTGKRSQLFQRNQKINLVGLCFKTCCIATHQHNHLRKWNL